MKQWWILVIIALLSSCAPLKWKAPEKSKAIQADLELLGAAPVDVASVLEAAGKVPAEDTNWEASLKTSLLEALAIEQGKFDKLWTRILQGVPKAQGNDTSQVHQYRARVLEQVKLVINRLNDDANLYRAATVHPKACMLDPRQCPECRTARDARDTLLVRYIVRIKDYHEANLDDVFVNSAEIGLGLDVGAIVASTLATAFTPVATKTAFAALATMFSGTKLAASKNVLNEKNTFAVMNEMVAERFTALARLREGMQRDLNRSGNTPGYSMQAAIDDLTDYFSAGGLNKALAAVEAAAAKSKATSEALLLNATLGGAPTTPTAITIQVYFTDKEEFAGVKSGSKISDEQKVPDKDVTIDVMNAVGELLVTATIKPSTTKGKFDTMVDIVGAARTQETVDTAKVHITLPDACTGLTVQAENHRIVRLLRGNVVAENIIVLLADAANVK